MGGGAGLRCTSGPGDPINCLHVVIYYQACMYKRKCAEVAGNLPSQRASGENRLRFIVVAGTLERSMHVYQKYAYIFELFALCFEAVDMLYVQKYLNNYSSEAIDIVLQHQNCY